MFCGCDVEMACMCLAWVWCSLYDGPLHSLPLFWRGPSRTVLEGGRVEGLARVLFFCIGCAQDVAIQLPQAPSAVNVALFGVRCVMLSCCVCVL